MQLISIIIDIIFMEERIADSSKSKIVLLLLPKGQSMTTFPSDNHLFQLFFLIRGLFTLDQSWRRVPGFGTSCEILKLCKNLVLNVTYKTK